MLPPIKAKYDSLGNQASYLGMPINDAIPDYGPMPGGLVGDPPNGISQTFEGSHIFINSINGDSLAYGESGGVTGSYYSNGDNSRVALRRGDSQIDFEWGIGSPSPAVSADRFRVDWRGRIRIPSSGYYTFYTISDDGVELAVCPHSKGYACGARTFIISNWTDHAATENSSASIYLESGSHFLSLFYYEGTGGAGIKLLWSGPGISKQVVPALYLDARYWGSQAGGSLAGEGGAPAPQEQASVPAAATPPERQTSNPLLPARR
jgi:hypothetical protein